MLLLPPVPPVDVLVPEQVTVAAGQTRSISAIVTNRGADALRNVVLRIGSPLHPVDERLGLQLPAACGAGGGCLVGDLAPGASRTFTFTLTPAGGPERSTFAVTAGGPDGVLGTESPITVLSGGSTGPASTGPASAGPASIGPASIGPAVSVTDATAIGGAFADRTGDSAAARVGVRNFGTVAGTASVRVTIPDGVRLTGVDDDCLPTSGAGVLDLATAGTVAGNDYTCFVPTSLNPGARHLFTFIGKITRGARDPGSVVVQETGTSAALSAAETGGFRTAWVILGGALPLIAALTFRRRRTKASPQTYAAASPIPIQVVPSDTGESARVPAATRTMRQGAAPPDIVTFGVPRPRRRR